jgi:hypothetical protein
MSSSHFYTFVCCCKRGSAFHVHGSGRRAFAFAFHVILAFLYLRLSRHAGICFSRTREIVPRIRGVEFSPEKGWSLQKGRGTQMPSLFLSALSITRLMAPRRNTCGVEVLSEYVYIFLSSLRFPVARVFGTRQLFLVTGTICGGLSFFMGLCVTRTAAEDKDSGKELCGLFL